MTKQYAIIHLNGFLYVVDNEASLEGAYLTDGVIVYHPTNSRDAIIRQEGGEAHLRKKVKAIIASNNPSLNTLPQLPEIESIVINIPVHIENTIEQVGLYTGGYVDGYKAASKEKKYSEENIVSFLKFLALDHNHKYHTQKDAWDDFKMQLDPKPIAIEVEMEEIEIEIYPDDSYPIYEKKPKVDKDNKLIIKKWIYE